MDENHFDAQEILRKRILEEKLNSGNTEDVYLPETESGSVFKSFSSNSSNENISLFHSDEDSNPDLEASKPLLSPASSSKPSLSLIHISEPTRRTPISYAVFCLK